MCDIAPFQMKCEYDDFQHDLFCCRSHHLCQAFNNLYRSIPIVKEFVSEYHCPDFERQAGEQE